MAGFFSKASSFLGSQANQEAPSHGGKAAEETRESSSPGGYGDLLAGAQAFMTSGKPSDEGGVSVDKEEVPHKAPGSAGGYGDLLASAQSLMASSTAKPSAGGRSDDKEGEFDKSPPSSGGYGDLLASAQAMMGSAKLSGGEAEPVGKEEAVVKTTSSGDSGYGDMYASAQVLMGAAKASREGAAADMGEVAGATANLIGAATHYGNLEKSAYGEYAHKAQTYLHDYQASHGKAPPHEGLQKPSSGTHGEESITPAGKPVKSSVDFEEKEEEDFTKSPVRSSEEEYK